MKKILSPLPGRVMAASYFFVVLCAVGFAVFDSLFVEHPDASLAGVLPIFATLPSSLLVLLATESSSLGVFVAALLVCGVLQAFAVWVLVGFVTLQVRGDSLRRVDV